MPIGTRQHDRIVRRNGVQELFRGPLPVMEHLVFPEAAADQLARLRFGDRLFDPLVITADRERSEGRCSRDRQTEVDVASLKPGLQA